jgi:hypothetical protein
MIRTFTNLFNMVKSEHLKKLIGLLFVALRNNEVDKLDIEVLDFDSYANPRIE